MRLSEWRARAPRRDAVPRKGGRDRRPGPRVLRRRNRTRTAGSPGATSRRPPHDPRSDRSGPLSCFVRVTSPAKDRARRRSSSAGIASRSASSRSRRRPATACSASRSSSRSCAGSTPTRIASRRSRCASSPPSTAGRCRRSRRNRFDVAVGPRPRERSPPEPLRRRGQREPQRPPSAARRRAARRRRRRQEAPRSSAPPRRPGPRPRLRVPRPAARPAADASASGSEGVRRPDRRRHLRPRRGPRRLRDLVGRGPTGLRRRARPELDDRRPPCGHGRELAAVVGDHARAVWPWTCRRPRSSASSSTAWSSAIAREGAPTIDGAVAAVRRIAAGRPAALASSSHRGGDRCGARRDRSERRVRGRRLVRRGRPRQADARRVPRSRPAARRRAPANASSSRTRSMASGPRRRPA